MKSNDKAVALAKDVLKWLKYMNIRAGQYFEEIDIDQLNKGAKQKSRVKILKNCEVCALGACVVSGFNLDGNSILDEYVVETNLHKIRNIFGVDESNEIEGAFERAEAWEGTFIPDAEAFGKTFKDNKARLAAIMQNIVDHDGYFIPGTNGKNARKYSKTFPAKAAK